MHCVDWRVRLPVMGGLLVVVTCVMGWICAIQLQAQDKGAAFALAMEVRNAALGDLSQSVAVPGNEALSQIGRNLESMSENFSGLVAKEEGHLP